MSSAGPGPDGVTITIKPGGPYLVRGSVTLLHPDGGELTPPPAKTPGVIKLCACGLTQNKPFCDSSHKRCQAPQEGVTPSGAPPG